MNRCDSQMEAPDPGDRFRRHAEIGVELRDQMAPAAPEFRGKPRQIEMIRGLPEYPPEMEQARWRSKRGCQPFRDDVFYDVKPSCPAGRSLRMSREGTRKSSIDLLQCESTVRQQVHRRSQKHLCADWSQPNNHKVPGSECLANLMPVL